MEGNRSKGKNTNKWRNKNEMEIGGRRKCWEKTEREKEKKEHDPRFSRRQGINQRWRENIAPLGSLFCFPTEEPNCSLAERGRF